MYLKSIVVGLGMFIILSSVSASELKYSCNFSDPGDEGKNYITKSASKGDISFDCNSREYLFTKGNDMRVANVVLKVKASYTFRDGTTLTKTSTSDAKKNSEHLVGKNSKEGSFDCVNSFDIVLPMMVFHAGDLDATVLAVLRTEPVSTTCPSWVNIQESDIGQFSEFEFIYDSKVTDKTGKVHQVLIYDALK